MSHITLGIDDVQVIDKLYPRLRPIELKIQEYQDNVEAAPRITVARGCVLVDGYHRWQAHKRNGATTVEAIDLGDMTDEEILVESSRLNSRHGTSLTMDEKRRLALVLARPHGSLTQGDTAKVLSVSLRTVEAWLAKADAEARAARKAEEEAKRKRDIAEAERLRAEGKTQRQIAEALGVDQATVARWLMHARSGAAMHQSTVSAPEADAQDSDDTEQSTTVDADPTDATTATPAAEPEPEAEPLDDENRQYLEQWSEDGDLVEAVRDGWMSVTDAVRAADGREFMHRWAQDDLQRKHRIGEGLANEALHGLLQALYHLARLPTENFKATQEETWSLLPSACDMAQSRIDELRRAIHEHMEEVRH